MPLERLILILVALAAAVWTVLMLVGVLASGPFGALLLIPLALVAYVVWRVIADRVGNEEDTYYEDNFDK
ncbi:MAG: hypothetical protein AAFW69_12490 [Pseudomonadota bacterium]